MTNLTLITFTPIKNDNGLIGYDTKEIEAKIGKDLYAAFTKWYAGKTGIVINGKFCVYPHDWELYAYLREKAVAKNKI